MKRGITLITLIITVTVFALLIGTIVTTFTQDDLQKEANKTINIYAKETLITQINADIKSAKLKKEMAGGEGILTGAEFEAILNQYGQYDSINLLLKLPERGIEIYLYEILSIPVGEYVQVSYSGNILTLTSHLTDIGYKIQYSLDNGETWSNYVDEIEVDDINSVAVRIVNEKGQVISSVENVIKGISCQITNDVEEGITSAEVITYTFTFSKDVLGFSANDINVINGEKGTFAGSGNIYTLQVSTINSGIQTVWIDEGCCLDQMENYNSAASMTQQIDITDL